MLGHIFRTESEAKQSDPRKKDRECKSRERSETGRGFKWQGPRAVYETGKAAV